MIHWIEVLEESGTRRLVNMGMVCDIRETEKPDITGWVVLGSVASHNNSRYMRIQLPFADCMKWFR